MALISLHDISFAYNGPPLLDGVDLHIQAGDRIGLLGRNGAGKSTLLKLLGGEVEPDSGRIDMSGSLEVARLQQDVPAADEGTAFDVVASALEKQGALLTRYDHLSRDAASGDEDALAQLGRVQEQIEAAGAWEMHRQVGEVLGRMGIEPERVFSALSGGMRRRVLLARALVRKPAVLLLDEPTNHLDIAAIEWLEQFMSSYEGTLVFVTHDRRFLERVANRIVEIERGRLFDWRCGYGEFLERKEAFLDAEEKRQADFDKRLAQEEEWIRRGLKARRRRNMGRVRRLQEMREQRRRRREKQGTADLQVHHERKSGRKVVRAKDLSFGYDGESVVEDFSMTIERGDKIGLVGPNGSGKTTLIKLLLGQLEPESGSVKLGTKLDVAYFDQHRHQLDPEKTVQENVSYESETVTVGGQQRHILSYLQDFLFTPERARSKVKVLSGGERNRVLLARLFTQPANVLVLDEPTNDLDIETLELLEELLVEFAGTLLLVSHDRAFLDNVVTSIVAYEGEGHFKEYVGGYSDWERQRPDPEQEEKAAAREEKKRSRSRRERDPNRLSYKEREELRGLPERIDALETERAEVHEAMSAPDFYQQEQEAITETIDRLKELEADIETAYERWTDLEARREAAQS